MGKIFKEIRKNEEEIVNLHFDKELGTPFYLERWKGDISVDIFCESFNLFFNSGLKESFDYTLRKKKL